MKDYAAASVFLPENLLREARRQRRLPLADVPATCVLDPDGDLVQSLRQAGRCEPAPGWACYHTALDAFTHRGRVFGVLGCAVGAPFAVLVAEQLFASGCRLLLSVTSAGWLGEGAAPRFLLIERALRDEGTSHHYLPPAPDVAAPPDAIAAARRAGLPGGVSWTTDAPYRETAAAIAAARQAGAAMVEMEAAGLYAFAAARRRPVACIAHVTNAMAQAEGDFEKGEDNGAAAVLNLLVDVAEAWQTDAAAEDRA